jgi:NAD(P)-dependent dehydrogenase (short-subunit alcohol dehydrogenase family)
VRETSAALRTCARLRHTCRERRSIINLTSIGACAAPGYATYAAMKAAVASLTRSLALELGERRIRSSIAPDLIQTPGTGPVRINTPCP